MRRRDLIAMLGGVAARGTGAAVGDAGDWHKIMANRSELVERLFKAPDRQ